jgi:putative transposase
MNPMRLSFCLAGWINREQQAVIESLEHYHIERNHQGLESQIIQPEFQANSGTGEITNRRRLGGMLN